MSLLNETIINKRNADIPENFSLFYAFFGVFRTLYFVPLIIYFANNLNRKKILVLCIVLFLLPFLEAYLRGARRIAFESIGLFLLILFIFNKINLKSFKTILISGLFMFVFLMFSFSVLKGRIAQDDKLFYKEIFKAKYNEFVPVNERAIKFIKESENDLARQLYFSEIHIGQYITHGVFEMNHTISKYPEYRTHGMFNFYLIGKTFNKLRITNLPLEKVKNPAGRNTYLTLFGEMFMDFGWASLIVMFLFGILQRIVFSLSREAYFMVPIMTLFLFTNMFMLVFNFMSAQFILSLSTFVLLFVLISIITENNYSGKFNNVS